MDKLISKGQPGKVVGMMELGYDRQKEQFLQKPGSRNVPGEFEMLQVVQFSLNVEENSNQIIKNFVHFEVFGLQSSGDCKILKRLH